MDCILQRNVPVRRLCILLCLHFVSVQAFSVFTSQICMSHRGSTAITSHSSERERAVVVGGSIAGLLSAAVLSKHFKQVVVLDRDDLSDAAAKPRRGVPQSTMPHTLFVRGYDILKELIPSVENSLMENGAVEVDWSRQFKVQRTGYEAFDIQKVSSSSADQWAGRSLKSVTCSRYMLEATVRECIRQSHPNIKFQHARVSGLKGNRQRIEGVQLDSGASLSGNLVIDASGRAGRGVKWLKEAGCGDVAETRIDAGPHLVHLLLQNSIAVESISVICSDFIIHSSPQPRVVR